MDELLRKYRTIAPLLGKIEEAVAGTNTGRSPQLREYYQFWEKAIFGALTNMVVNAMSSFLEMMQKRSRKGAQKGAQASTPLFKLSATLSHPEVVVQPAVNEVIKFLNRLVRRPRPPPSARLGVCISGG